jgi:hypothetical protein
MPVVCFMIQLIETSQPWRIHPRPQAGASSAFFRENRTQAAAQSKRRTMGGTGRGFERHRASLEPSTTYHQTSTALCHRYRHMSKEQAATSRSEPNVATCPGQEESGSPSLSRTELASAGYETGHLELAHSARLVAASPPGRGRS